MQGEERSGMCTNIKLAPIEDNIALSSHLSYPSASSSLLLGSQFISPSLSDQVMAAARGGLVVPLCSSRREFTGSVDVYSALGRDGGSLA